MLEKKPLITHMYTADPSAHVFDDTLYIYPSHDRDIDMEPNDNGDQYDMEDYHVFSMADVTSPPTDLGLALHIKDVPWASKQMWAPDAAKKGDRYFLYFPARDRDGLFRIGVATSGAPGGPFTAEPHYIAGSFSIDPCVFTDDDGSSYMVFGGIWGGQLDKWASGTFDPNGKEPDGDVPAVCPKIARLSDSMLEFAEAPRDLVIADDTGTPLRAHDKDRRYFEGPWLHKYNGTYYFSYSTGDTHRLVYATSPTLRGPYTWRGLFLPPVLGWTTHHSIVEFQGQWWLFYHDCEISKGIDHKRNVKFCRLGYGPDGSILPIEP